MINNLCTFLSSLRSDSRIKSFDETSTKQAVILRMLQLLGWDVFNVDEVFPEFTIEGKRVDYALRINNSNEFFLEVKRPSEDLDRHQEQLLEYAFRQGVELAALTNGITWFFYLPTKKGDWSARRFYAIDIFEQDSNEASEKFVQILSRENIKNGDAVNHAENIYKGRIKKKTIKETFPEAWNKIISEPDTLMTDLVAEVVEKICGFKPDREDAEIFFQTYQNKFIIAAGTQTIAEVPKARPVSPKAGDSVHGRKEPWPDNFKQFVDLKSLSQRGADLVKAKPKALKIQNDEFEVSNWSQVDEIFVGWLIKQGHLNLNSLPINSSSKKYFINSRPEHNNPELDGSWKKINDQFFIDVKYNVPNHIRNMLNTLNQLGIRQIVNVFLSIDNGA
jgi:hypothetical protein